MLISYTRKTSAPYASYISSGVDDVLQGPAHLAVLAVNGSPCRKPVVSSPSTFLGTWPAARVGVRRAHPGEAARKRRNLVCLKSR